jgi:hypothetical protein
LLRYSFFMCRYMEFRVNSEVVANVFNLITGIRFTLVSYLLLTLLERPFGYSQTLPENSNVDL